MAQQKTALIVGMAKSGIAAARLLYENGYRVIINDMKPEIKGLFDALSGIAYEVRLGDDPMDLLERALGEPFDPKYFTDYLEEKFSKIYGL